MRALDRPMRTSDFYQPPPHVLAERKRFDELVPRPPDVLDRFDEPIPNQLCWNFTGSTFRTGYGRFYSGGREYLAHRFAFELWVGAVPETYRVGHTCTANLICCRPDHLDLRQAPARPSRLTPDKLDDLRFFFRTDYDDPNPHYTIEWAMAQYGISERYARRVRDEVFAQIRTDPSNAARVARHDALLLASTTPRRRSSIINPLD